MKQVARLKRLSDRVRENRRDALRVGLQTAVAASGTYALIQAVGLDAHLSWAVIASLFTISVSADSSVMQGLGRIAGAFLGVALGLGAALIDAHIVVGLALAAALANMVANVWPNLRYAAVTAAIVALDPSPDAVAATIRAAAILMGTAIGVATTFVVWPRFGRERAATTLRAALGDCERLLRLIVEGVETDEREERDATHARFLGRLETLHGQVRQTRFAPRLRSGASLRPAALALENLWHGLVILDRAITDERTVIGPDLMRHLRPEIRRVQEAALSVIRELCAAISEKDAPTPSTQGLCAAIASARDLAGGLSGEAQRALGVHAVVFAIDELEERIVQLVRVLMPGLGEPGGTTIRGADVIREAA